MSLEATSVSSHFLSLANKKNPYLSVECARGKYPDKKGVRLSSAIARIGDRDALIVKMSAETNAKAADVIAKLDRDIHITGEGIDEDKKVLSVRRATDAATARNSFQGLGNDEKQQNESPVIQWLTKHSEELKNSFQKNEVQCFAREVILDRSTLPKSIVTKSAPCILNSINYRVVRGNTTTYFSCSLPKSPHFEAHEIHEHFGKIEVESKESGGCVIHSVSAFEIPGLEPLEIEEQMTTRGQKRMVKLLKSCSSS